MALRLNSTVDLGDKHNQQSLRIARRSRLFEGIVQLSTHVGLVHKLTSERAFIQLDKR